MEKSSRFAGVRDWYKKFETPISSLSLIGGFVFDALTLTRVDQFWENFWVGAHLLIVATCIIFINVVENKGSDEADPERLHFWLVNVLQFFFGGLLSTYLVFYFRSGTIAVSWPFFLVLAAAFIANERLKRHYERLTFQICILFLSILLFSIYIVPVLVHAIGPTIFIISTILGFIVLLCFLLILRYASRENFKKSRIPLFFSIATIFIGINALYFFDLIPPIPLSLKDAGIYQTFIVNGPGNYTVGYEDQGLFGFLNPSQTVQITAGTPLYAYSAIFSPASFATKIAHEWQYYDPAAGKWVTRDTIDLSVVGGNDGGYRTFSEVGDITPGKWRVNIETLRGQVIGRLAFDVVIVDTPPSLDIKNID